MKGMITDMIANYHGHTMHCKHGVGTTREHIEAAIAFGLEEVAITEHVPIENTHLSRIDYEDFHQFMCELNSLKEEYNEQIRVLTGLECEYIPKIFQNHLDLVEKYDIDFLVLGHHFSNLSQPGNHFFETNSHAMANEYKDDLIAGIKSGYFKIIGHPDIFLNLLPMDSLLEEYSREILSACESSQVAIEINGNGMRTNKGYPSRDFWQLATEYNLVIVINSDSHSPDEILDKGVINTYKFAEELGLQVTERLDF